LEAALGAAEDGDRPPLSWSGADPLAPVARAVGHLAGRVRSQLATAEAEQERLQAVLEGMVEGVLVLDREGRVILANPRLRELFGAWGEVLGRPALEVVRVAEVEAALSRVAEGEEPLSCDIRLGSDPGRVLEMHAGRFPGKGDRLGTVAIFHDVTDVRNLEQLRQEFVANVSHELRTPLTAIRGFAETLRDGDVEPTQQKQYLDIIERHAGRLGALIEDLLALSRIEGRHDPVVLEALDLLPVTRSVLRDLEPRLRAKGLEHSVEGQGPMVAQVDRRALEQVLLNLLDNAIKYTDPGGAIRVVVATTGERVRLTVADTGMGIPEKDRARIFERFYRVEKARSRDLGGTGLGLAIVKHLVQAMGGDVALESKVGEGTALHVLLPPASH
jgi:two-component system phosphate regulon sensor histidine kinase PhoR